tara:strand:- start:31 stop:423 length:393 start_codon:yes stop_codon:yes gene_type:complete
MNESNKIDLELLPKGLREIAELIGVNATLKVVKAYGGTRFWFCSKFDKGSDLVKLIGMSKAKILWENYQGERIVIDKAEAALRELRDREIFSKLNTHKRSSLALEYHLTEETIYRIQRDRQQDKLQMKLL